MGKKSAAKVLERDREVEVQRRVAAVVRRSASATSASAARRCWPITSARSTTIERASLEELEQVREIGPVLAASVRSWFDEPAQSRADRRLPQAGLKLMGERKVAPAGPQPLAGKTYVITGELDGMSREEAQAQAAGARRAR